MNLDLSWFLKSLNETLTLFLVFPFIILLGLYLTYKLRCVQLSKIKDGFLFLLKKDKDKQGEISHYEAIAAVLAGNFGTGNISGMAVALSTGGPGALVWMWLMAFLGAAIQYASCMLGVKYRQKNEAGEFVGGPMYYLSNGLGFKKLGLIFACFTVLAALTVGNLAQVNSVILPLEKMGLSPFVCGVVIALFVGLVILGGIQRLASFASYIIPFKAVLYLGTALIIILLNLESVIPAFKLMFSAAFDFHSLVGGTLGYGVFKAITTGFDRGLFATDAGTGIVPILQASARTSNPVVDGLVTLVAPFLVMIVCTTTGLVLIITGAWQQPGLRSTNMVTYAFENGLNHQIGSYIVVIALLLFAYTTILAWAYCAEKAIGFISNAKQAARFKYFYILLIPFGTLIHVDLIWILADLSISLMLIVNLIGVTCLSREVIGDSRAYFLEESQNKAKVLG